MIVLQPHCSDARRLQTRCHIERLFISYYTLIADQLPQQPLLDI